MAPASDSPSSISRKKKIHQSVSSQRADRTTPLTRKIDPRTSQESKSKKIIAAKTFPVAAFEPNKSRNQEGLKRVFREMSSTSIAPPSNDIVLPISLIVPGANPGAYKELESTTIDTSVGFKKEDTQVGKSNFENSVLLTKNKSIELNDDQQTLRKASRVRANVQETGSDTLKSYIKTMANHELLRPEDEAVLGNEIQTQVRWEETRLALEEEILRAPTHTEWANALNITVPQLKRQLKKSQKAKAAMMEANLRLVVTIARQTMKKYGGNSKGMFFQDACQEGIIGLSKACERFDPSVGVRFNTFAKWFIRRGILDSMSHNSRIIRLPRSTMKRINTIRVAEVQLLGELGRKPSEDEVAHHLGMDVAKVRFYKRSAEDALSMDRQLGGKGGKGSKASGSNPEDKELTLGQTLSDGDNKTPADAANQQMLKDDVRRMVLTLTPKEQAVVRMRFGLDDGQPQTHDSIAKLFQVTRDQIRKIEASAILKLRQPYRNQSVQCYMNDI